ncbi:MAG: hypothetical protein KGJ23_01320 [Euryarchaeota archaeon]|nr:hypothetical protein [Euryarchaeota archaeon]MDE1835238.1 hypothetical protein [Euryarchaeota archaeon]MDE1881041.1 hypothetical protein [Euryarchaeota archaeon]MDE2043534.1 hypothetical protein [Thermoplasmata archaeon]
MTSARPLRINRFTVMAMLQAARARHMGLSEESAYSWGLNRAIWYAAAKKGFKTGNPGEGPPSPSGRPTLEFRLGSDMAYRTPESEVSAPVFVLGAEAQTAEAFRSKIASRFGTDRSFRVAWEEATRIVSEVDPEWLQTGSSFYSHVYKPRRDALVKKWADDFGEAPPG